MVTDMEAYYIMLRDFNLETRVTPSQVVFLKSFAESPFLNAYQLEKKLRGTPFEMAYVNVRKQLSDLAEKGLVEKAAVDSSESRHKANFFRATDIGLHFLFSKYRETIVLPIELPNMVKYYRGNLLVRMFLCDWFDEKTLVQLTPELNLLLTSYLQQMTLVSEDYMEIIKQGKIKNTKFFFANSMSEFGLIQILGLMMRVVWIPKTEALMRGDSKFRKKISDIKVGVEKLFSIFSVD
jgi:hypothetical protein